MAAINNNSAIVDDIIVTQEVFFNYSDFQDTMN